VTTKVLEGHNTVSTSQKADQVQSSARRKMDSSSRYPVEMKLSKKKTEKKSRSSREARETVLQFPDVHGDDNNKSHDTRSLISRLQKITVDTITKHPLPQTVITSLPSDSIADRRLKDVLPMKTTISTTSHHAFSDDQLKALSNYTESDNIPQFKLTLDMFKKPLCNLEIETKSKNTEIIKIFKVSMQYK
jgi:hypothetical protein